MIANLTLQVTVAALNGSVDKFILVAFIVTGAYALVICCGVGLVYYVIRRTRPD